MNARIPAALSLLLAATALGDPQLTSWYTADSGRYARIYDTVAAESTGPTAALKTWSRGSGTQTQSTYAGVSEVSYSTNYVYIRTTGLASYVMGPWYLDSGKQQNFPNFPSNTGKIYRIPRTPTIPATKTTTGGGAVGYFVNGVALFDMRDTYSYSTSNNTDASPVSGIGLGDGIWNREAYANEAVTFDAALAHQAGNQYHYHAQAIALRYQLGDHVDFNSSTNRYTESTGAVTKHSPILAWAQDGIPVYGPYGYDDPNNASSGVRRMISGFVLRNGQYGTTNLNTTGRHTLPAWAARVQGRSATLTTAQYGPNVNTTYALGHYLEDYDYLGDLGISTGFDLNEYNARYCVTPEFPGGTWAYFSTINADGSPAYPFNTGRQFMGSPTGGEFTSMPETTTIWFKGGPNKTEYANAPAVDSGTGAVTLTWSAIEGGTYKVEASNDLTTWSTLTASTTATSATASVVENSAALTNTKRFYRITRTALASFDSTGFNYTAPGTSTSTAPGGSAARGTTVTVTITLPTTPPLPPVDRVPTSITLDGSISGTAISRPTSGTAQCTFVIPAGASTGTKNIVVTFNPAPTYTMTGAFTIN